MQYRKLLIDPLVWLQSKWRVYRRSLEIKTGIGSYIYPPRKLSGPQYIQVGDRSVIFDHAWLAAYDSYASQRYTPRLIIGNDVTIGSYSCITSLSSIVIEDGCLLSEFVYITDHVHGFDPEAGLVREQPLVSKGDVVVGAHSFIGYRVSILSGVHLGQHCVVGAHSVVTHSFPDYSMIAGIPARLIKRYSLEDHAWVFVTD